MPIFQRLAQYKLFWLFAPLLLASDLLTKYLVKLYIPPYTYLNPIPVLEPFLYWVHVHNTGAAWSLFSGKPMLLAFLAIFVLIVIYFYRHQLELKQPYVQITIGILVGGILGNLVDRFAYGYVIDFIDVHLPFYRWPAFNVADIGICLGAIFYSIFSIFYTK